MAPELQEVLPKAGLVVSEKGQLSEMLCKPKILPLKSVSLERIEKMEVCGPYQPQILTAVDLLICVLLQARIHDLNNTEAANATNQERRF